MMPDLRQTCHVMLWGTRIRNMGHIYDLIVVGPDDRVWAALLPTNRISYMGTELSRDHV